MGDFLCKAKKARGIYNPYDPVPGFDQNNEMRHQGQGAKKKEASKPKGKKLIKRAKSVTKSKEVFPQVKIVSMNLEMFDVTPARLQNARSLTMRSDASSGRRPGSVLASDAMPHQPRKESPIALLMKREEEKKA